MKVYDIFSIDHICVLGLNLRQLLNIGTGKNETEMEPGRNRFTGKTFSHKNLDFGTRCNFIRMSSTIKHSLQEFQYRRIYNFINYNQLSFSIEKLNL